MTTNKRITDSGGWRAIVWTLRATVALQCLGNAWWFLRVEESPLLSFLWGTPDIGGMGLSEATALGVTQAIGWCAILAVVFVLLRPCGWVLLPLAALQLAIALATIRMGAEFQIAWPLLPPQVAIWFPILSHSARIAAPLGLWLLERPSIGIGTAPAVLRVAIVATFFAHGIEAAAHFPKFVDFNILATRQALGREMTQTVSETALTIIAGFDILAAAAVAAARFRSAIWYMVFWGFVTAASRILVQGWDNGIHEFATRAPHFGAPLVIALYWWLSNNGKETVTPPNELA